MAEPYIIKPSPGKGLGMFSTKQLQPGEPILRDTKVMKTPCPPTDKHILAAYHHLSKEEKDSFNKLHCGNTDDHETKTVRTFQLHAFEGKVTGHAEMRHSYILFKVTACNHSCLPNAEVEEGDHRLVAIKNIRKGDEIFVSHLSPRNGRSTAERQKFLLSNYAFVCCCEVCTLKGHKAAMSDARRKILKALQIKLSFNPGHFMAKSLIQAPLPKPPIPWREAFTYAVLSLGIFKAEGMTGHIVLTALIMARSAMTEQMEDMVPIVIISSAFWTREWMQTCIKAILASWEVDDSSEDADARSILKKQLVEHPNIKICDIVRLPSHVVSHHDGY
jgi:hypothetical protein